MNETIEQKVAKLPAWAREYIKRLEDLPRTQTEALVEQRRKTERLEKTNRVQQDRIDAMVLFFQCAAKGGNEVAAAVQRIVEDYLTYDEK
jgi:hypothetical protein